VLESSDWVNRLACKNTTRKFWIHHDVPISMVTESTA
jgi:hypothetical protein